MKSSKSPEEWAKVIAEFDASGLSQAEFCRSNKINPKTFSTWKKKFSKPKSKSPQAKRANQPAIKPAARQTKSSTAKQTTTSSASFGTLHVVFPNKAEMHYQCSNKEALIAAIKTVADLDLQD